MLPVMPVLPDSLIRCALALGDGFTVVEDRTLLSAESEEIKVTPSEGTHADAIPLYLVEGWSGSLSQVL